VRDNGSLLNPGEPIDLTSKTDQEVSQVQRFSNTQAGSEPFAKFATLLFFSTGYKSVDLIRSALKRFVLIVQPLQFHYSLDGLKGCLSFAGLRCFYGVGREKFPISVWLGAKVTRMQFTPLPDSCTTGSTRNG